MIIYLLITFIIIVLSVVVFTPKFRRGLKINEPGENFFLTLLATLIGVFIGITLSNYEEQRTENENVVKV